MQIPEGHEIFLSSTGSKPALLSTQSIHWVPGALSLGDKRSERETDHWAGISANLKKSLIYTSTPLRLHGIVLIQLSTGTTPNLTSHSEDRIFSKKSRPYLPASLTEYRDPNIFHLSLYEILNWNKKFSFSLSYNIRRAIKHRGWARPLSHAASKAGFTFLALIWGGTSQMVTGLSTEIWFVRNITQL
jgi:hypothetical protein